MAPPAREDRISVPAAARLLGLTPHAVYSLTEKGELGHVQVYELSPSGRPRRRRSFDLTRQDVYDFIDRARVQPGTLAYLYAPPTSPPELELRMLDRFVKSSRPKNPHEDARYEATRQGSFVTLWVRRPLPGKPGHSGRVAIAQVRWERQEGTWTLYWTEGRSKWHPWTPKGQHVALREALQIIEEDRLGIFIG